VVDNASVDGSADWISKQFPEVHWIQNQVNVGFSKANNQAIREIQADYILLLNPDTLLEENTLQKCFDFMKTHPDAGALGVRMIDGSGKFLPESKRQVPGLWSSFCRLSYLSDLFPKSKWFSGYYLGHLSEFETHEIEVLCGAFMFIRSQVLETTGLLDESFFMYGEDIDLSYRILKSGWKIYYFPDTSIIHYKGESTKKSSLNYIKTFYGAMSIYVNKHYSRGSARWFAMFINVAIFFRAFLSGIAKLFKAFIWPLTDGLLAFIILSRIKHLWAHWYFGDLHYYDNSPINVLLGIYMFVWILALWIGGHYDKDRRLDHSIQSVFWGTVVILILYALLPDDMRASRALILIGSLVILMTALTTTVIKKYFIHTLKADDSSLHVGIVADKAQSQKLTEL
jgi:GT2 family glycosyltransferase